MSLVYANMPSTGYRRRILGYDNRRCYTEEGRRVVAAVRRGRQSLGQDIRQVLRGSLQEGCCIAGRHAGCHAEMIRSRLARCTARSHSSAARAGTSRGSIVANSRWRCSRSVRVASNSGCATA